jgi:UDP-N-acetylglucosamine diphosphorylase/glucosamine-1-phosphate N-acetyltransferase
MGDEDILLGDHIKLEPGVVLDATKGPVIIDDGASIGANSVLTGPCYIGKNSGISPLSLIRAGASIGPMCKMGGEISNSIILGYSNKAHEGYLGDSYLGEWVNFGAGTTTSNLKNTYGPIRVQIGPKRIETDRRFLGALVGDHTKTAIGTRLTSGAYVGYCSILACSQILPGFTPSFSFITDKGAEPYHMEKAREVISQVFGRRGKDWNEGDEMLFNYAAETAREIEGG